MFPDSLGGGCSRGLLPIDARGEPVLELHVLGTSSARFAHGRAVSGSVLSTPGGLALIDCGEGMQQRVIDHNRALKAAGIQTRTRLSRVRAILLTHGHLDHCWGVLPLLQTLALDRRKDPLTIIGPTSKAALKWVAEHPGESPPEGSGVYSTDLAIQCAMWQSLGSKDEDFGYPIDWVLVPIDGDEPFEAPVQPLEGVTLTMIPTLHGIPSCGWLVVGQGKSGQFDRDKADSANLTRTERSRLAAGEDVEKAGELLLAAEFRGPPRLGRSLLVTGDTAASVAGLQPDALPTTPDLLIHEATFTAENQEKATLYNHSTAADAALAATSCGARALGMTHFSSRIDRLSPSVSEAREHFRGPICACCEGDWFHIDSEGTITHNVRCDDDWNSQRLET